MHHHAFGNCALHNDCQSPPDKSPSGRGQRNNLCTPPTLHRRASDQLGPRCAAAAAGVPPVSILIEDHNDIPPGTVSSATLSRQFKPWQRCTRGFDVSATPSLFLQSIYAPVRRPTQSNKRKTCDCPGSLQIDHRQDCPTHVAIVPGTTRIC